MECRARHAATLLLSVGLLAACGGSGGAATTTVGPPVTTPAPLTTPVATTTPVVTPTAMTPPATTAPTPVTAPVTTSPPDDRDVAAAVKGWTGVWSQGADPAVEPGAITGVGSPEIGTTVRALTGADIDGTQIAITHQVVSAEAQPDGSIAIVDCALFDPHPNTPIPSQHLTGSMTQIDGTWSMTAATYHDGGCIPADVNADILDAYHAYWAALEASGNPPDPDHPALEATMIDPQLSTVKNALSEMQESGDVYNGTPDLSPFVVDIQSSTSAVVADCLGYGDDFGFFLPDGTRTWPTTDGPLPVVVQLDRVGDTWVASERDANHPDCYDPTVAPVVVGG